MTASLHLRICLDFIETALLNSGSRWDTSELYEAHQRAWGYLRCPQSEWTQTHTTPHYPPGSDLPTLLTARNFLAPYAADYAQATHESAFAHALAQYDAKLPEAFARYRQMRLNDIGAIRPITPEQLAELQAYPGFETILVEDWYDEAELLERVPVQEIVLQSLGFLEEYVRPYSRSHQMLFDYPAIPPLPAPFSKAGFPPPGWQQNVGSIGSIKETNSTASPICAAKKRPWAFSCGKPHGTKSWPAKKACKTRRCSISSTTSPKSMPAWPCNGGIMLHPY